jgi:predicted AAA+ superfamily ATPase
MIVQRFIRKPLLDALEVSPIVFFNGARQAGKSTLVLNNLIE